MALIKCPECGQEVSSRAKMCVHCGYPIEELLCENMPVEQKEDLNTNQEFKSKHKVEVSAEVMEKLVEFSVILEKMKGKLKQAFLNVRKEKNVGWVANGPELVRKKLEESYEDINDYLKNHEINGVLEKEVFLDADLIRIEMLQNTMILEHKNTINKLNSIVEQKAQEAYNKEADNYNGLGFGIISNSLIDHLLYMGMESSKLKKTKKKAQEAADAVRDNSDVISNAGKITEQNYYIPFENEVLTMIESFFMYIEKKIYINNNAEYISEDIKKIVKNKIDAFNKKVPKWEERIGKTLKKEHSIRIEQNIEIGEEGYAPGYVMAGFIYEELEEFDKVYECYKKALFIDPLNDLALNNMGLFLGKNHTRYFNPELCIKHLSKSTLPVAYNNLASKYYMDKPGFENYKDANKALKLYLKALSKGYDVYSVYNNIGTLYGEKGYFLRACVYCHLASIKGSKIGEKNFDIYAQSVSKKYGKHTIEEIKTIKTLEDGEQLINKVLSRKSKWF